MKNINVLNKSFKKIAIIDEYISLMWCVRYNEIGALDLELEASLDNIALFQAGHFISRDDDEHIYKIEVLEISTNEDGNDILLVGAIDLISIFNQRIITKFASSTYSIKNFFEQIFENELQDVRGFGFPIEIETDYNPAKSLSTTHNYIGDEIFAACKDEELNCVLTFDTNNEKLLLKLNKIVNRSNNQIENVRVVFSTDNNNLISSKYNVDITDYKNVAYIYNETTTKRGGIFVGETTGLDRREILIESTNNDEDSDLEKEANQTLLESSITTSFESEIDPRYYTYKIDYNIGDIITIYNQYGFRTSARISEIIETWDDEGYSLEPIFDYFEEPYNIDRPVIFTEGGSEMLSTENLEPIIIETSPLIDETSTNYLLTENGQLIDLEN